MNTNESNKTFSSKRFTALLKSDLTVNKGNYIKLSIATLGVFAALAALISINASLNIAELKRTSGLGENMLLHAIEARQLSYGSMYLAISSWIICIGLTVLGSLTFSNFSTKRQRISSLMIPASRSEKFALRFLIYDVAGIVLLISGLFLGLGICQIAFGGGGAPLNSVIEFLDAEYMGTISTIIVLLALSGNAIYALGSSIWPKLSWIKTWVVLMVIEWAFAAVLMILAAANINWEAFIMLLMNLEKTNAWVILWSGIVIIALFNIACWVVAWYRFKNTQIIQRFMTK